MSPLGIVERLDVLERQLQPPRAGRDGGDVRHPALVRLLGVEPAVQQVLGHGIAAKVSVRLGEGVLNGLLTARLGLAAIEVTRPLPFAALPCPTLSDVAGNLLRRRDAKPEIAVAQDL